MSPVFGHGGLRLYLLRLLEDEPRHGYELIRLLEDRFLGLYSPSPGTVYPRLAQLERDGLVEHDDQGGRKVYRLTGPGREELVRRGGELAGLDRRVLGSVGHGTGTADTADVADAARDAARDVAREVREDVHSAVRDLRTELRAAARDVRHEQRRSRRPAPLTPELDELDAALSAFRVDVLAAARSHRAGAAAVPRVVQVLREVRVQLAPLLAGAAPPAPGGAGPAPALLDEAAPEAAAPEAAAAAPGDVVVAPVVADGAGTATGPLPSS